MNGLKQNFNSTDIYTRRFIVNGKVQGVFFRASTQKQAMQHSLSGFARNLHNGSVEVLLQGLDANIQLVANWLEEGPEFAKVKSVVEVDARQSPLLHGFEIM